jgi:integrase
MATINRLSARFVESVKTPGTYADGNGLLLQVTSATAKSWVFRYSRRRFGKPGEANMGLGPLRIVGLAEARELARECGQQILKGIDPIEHRNAARLAQRLEAARQMTFDQCAEKWIEWNGGEPSTVRQNKSCIRRFLSPKLGKLLIQAINVDLCEEVIAPYWETKHPTALNIQGCLKGILDWAATKELRTGANPASISKGTPLYGRLKPRDSAHTVEHMRPLPYKEIGTFMATLRAYRNLKTGAIARGMERPRLEHRSGASYALEFLILTAVREDQVVKLRWTDDIDDEGVWTCHQHKTRKKVKQPHIVVLSGPARAIIETMRMRQQEAGISSEYVFVHLGGAGARLGARIDEKGPLVFLRQQLGRSDIDVHGFRTTFKSWSVDHGYDDMLSEMQLGHVVGTSVRNIYARDAKLVDRRRPMMEDWAAYCGRTEPLDAKVIPMRTAQMKEAS